MPAKRVTISDGQSGPAASRMAMAAGLPGAVSPKVVYGPVISAGQIL
jgi:hypothetical protein